MLFTWTFEKKKLKMCFYYMRMKTKFSKNEGDCIKGLVTNTEPFRTERDPN